MNRLPSWIHRTLALLKLVAIVRILVILATFRLVVGFPRCTVRNKIRCDLQAIVHAAALMKVDTGSFPETVEELADRGLLAGSNDPWNRPYLYEVRDGSPVARCLGRDGQEGGEGENADYEWPDRRK